MGLDDIEDFNLETHGLSFEDYVKRMREELRDRNRDQQLANYQNVRWLPPTTRQQAPTLYRRRIGTAGAEIFVWIRADNLYIVGFEAGGRIYEFGRDPKNDAKEKNKKAKKKKEKEEDQEQQQGPLIPGAIFLGFDGSYNDLGDLQQSDPNGPGEFGWHQLDSAIRGLAAYTGAEDAQTRPWLRIIIVTFSESLRLHNVCEFMDGLLRGYKSGSLEKIMILCIKSWGAISACLAVDIAGGSGHQGPQPEGEVDPLYSRLSDICRNTDEACRLVALILNTGPAADEPGPSRGRPRREAAGDGDVFPVLGLTFVEIFSAVVVQAGTATGRNRNLLYGHIEIDDCLSQGSCELLFTRGRDNALPPRAGGHVELVGPARAVWGYGEIVMRVHLIDAIPGAVADMTPDVDDELSGKLVWNTYDTPRMVYDEVEEYVFEGESGAVDVRCAVVTNAVVATVTIRRTGGTGGAGQKVDVYGTVSAATAMFAPQDKVTLFDRGWKDAASVGAGEDVALLRKVAVVPLRSPLTISADLWTRAHVTDMSADHKIASGAVAVFSPSPFGVFRKVIGGGDFEVCVTWSRS